MDVRVQAGAPKDDIICRLGLTSQEAAAQTAFLPRLSSETLEAAELVNIVMQDPMKIGYLPLLQGIGA